ncbi:acyl-CoA desaturase [Kribbella sp. CA-253562]|uniref:acyl-CoA desaturase n=1 Tax=Kribbella sp. CA-253562 TaxID=3239942 RepID=UPI003D94EF5F
MTSAPEIDEAPPEEFQATGGRLERGLIWVFIVVPTLALLPGIYVAWGGWIGWRDVVLLVVFYVLTTTGIGVGYHRGFTHGSFKPKRGLKVALAVAGSMALEGPVIRWVADHRKHHKFSDRDGDPHSPWRYGTNAWAVTKGFVFAHVGWVLWGKDRADPKHYAPDLLKDRDVAAISRQFRVWAAISLLAPAVIGGLWDRSWHGAATGFFWGTLVRIALMHHVTFSINSICHVTGGKPFASRDRAGNVWWLAILSQGESWHNLHHADPTCARHGVLKGQVDINARLIKWFERFGWAYDVRWPNRERLDKKRTPETA